MTVDDDEMNQFVVKSTLEPAGYVIVQAKSGVECLEYAKPVYQATSAPGPAASPHLQDWAAPGAFGLRLLRQRRSLTHRGGALGLLLDWGYY
jgi:CheY-like chemotaxis protein